MTAGAPGKPGGGAWLTIPAYLIAFLFAADTLSVWASHLFPSHPDNPLWRHMAVGTLSEPIMLPVLSLLLLLGGAIAREDRRLVAAAGRLGLGAAVVLLVLMVPYAMDSRTLIDSLPSRERPRFTWLIAKQSGQLLLGALVFATAAIAARRLVADPGDAAEPEGGRAVPM